jgi:hypothetical protein
MIIMEHKVGLIPESWLLLLEKIQRSNGKFTGLEAAGRWIGALESLRARRLVWRDDNGYYRITPAGSAILEEIRGQSVLDAIAKHSDVLSDIRVAISKREKFLEQRLNQRRTVGLENYRNIFIIARLWNSTTPIFPPSEADATTLRTPNGGGGYILLWDEICLCIDPGLNFLTRFYKRGLSPSDIDGIIVTHDHFDHTRDVEGLISLLYELKKRGITKKVDFLGSQGTLIKYKTLLEKGVIKGYLNAACLRPGQMIRLPSWRGQIDLRVTRAVHEEIHDNSPVGLMFELRQPERSASFRLGITGDTSWKPELYSEFAETDLLVAHLGTVETRNGEFSERHLGLSGLGLLIKGISPKLTIVSEFGEEVGDKRYQLCCTLQKVTNCKVIPGELDTEIRLPSLEGRFGPIKPFSPIDEFIREIYKLGGITVEEEK